MELHGTTVLCIRDKDNAIMIGDGQITLGDQVIKNTAQKLIKTNSYFGECIIGIAGATSVGIKMRNMLVKSLQNTILTKACEKVAKYFSPGEPLHGGQVMLIATNIERTLILTGSGDILVPEYMVYGIGSGGAYASAAALAALDAYKECLVQPNLSILARSCMNRVAQSCIYTNNNFQEILISRQKS